MPSAWLAAALILHAAVSLGYMQALPLFNWPDEPAHFNVVRELAAGGGFGVMAPGVWEPEVLERLKTNHFRGLEDPLASSEIAGLRYEAHQPPLYYLAAAGVYRIWPSPTGLKLFNLLLSCVGVGIAFVLASRLAPDELWIRVLAATFLALLPSRCFLAVSIGNDVAAELLFGLFLLAVVSGASAWRVGLLAGVGLLIKANLVLMLPLYGVWLLARRFALRARTSSSALRDLWRPWLLACALAVTIASPWLVRNIVLYGWTDPLAVSAGALGWQTSVGAAVEAGRPGLTAAGTHGLASFFAILYQSWWGVFGWMEMFPEGRVLAVYLLLTGLALAGWVLLVLRRSSRFTLASAPTGTDLWLAASLGAFAAALVLYSLFDFQPQGRYLLTAAAGSAVLFARGLALLLGRFVPWGVVAVALSLLAINFHSIRHVIPWYLGAGS